MVLPRIVVVAGMFAVVVAVLLLVSLLICVGPGRLRNSDNSREPLSRRVRAVSPYAVLLVAVFGVRIVFREQFWALSEAVGYNMTGVFYAVEGNLPAQVQTVIPGVAAPYFAFTYMFGYALIVVGPLVLYLFADSLRHLKTVLLAYTINYAVATILYTLVIARGPRIASSGTRGIIQESFPYFTLLTGQVNSPQNVFPSLHTSLAVTVFIVAVLSRREFPRWLSLTTVLTASIVVSTVYLGIHWLTDIVAGFCLAVGSVWLARRSLVRATGRERNETVSTGTEHGQD
jgi:membrane-associated phospholipid phosphatase